MDELEESLKNLGKEKMDLEAALAQIEEAVAMLNHQGQILKANESFLRLFNSLPIEGKYIWQVVRSTKFQELFFEWSRGGEKSEGEIYVDQKPYLVKLFSIDQKEISAKSQKKTIIILKNIQAEKNLEIIKKELVANISHELRTPLTAIKGYLETLEEEKLSEEARSYVSIIKNNVERLERIVRDLLILSELETRRELQEKEEVNLAEIAQRVINQFEEAAKKKNLFLHLEVSPVLPIISGDTFRLEQMFINLIDNAIKYTDKGGITVKLEEREKEVLIKVEDTGIGIAPEHLDRIFERFYVVDRSRSRRLGGTGLGLSIVKHIVLLHGGKISVQSREGVGTTFLISLPH